jgi:hypothetical protein
MTPHKDLSQNKQFVINFLRDSFQGINKNGKNLYYSAVSRNAF